MSRKIRKIVLFQTKIHESIGFSIELYSFSAYQYLHFICYFYLSFFTYLPSIRPLADPKGPDLKCFLKAPLAPIFTNYEERAPKKRDFWSKFS